MSEASDKLARNRQAILEHIARRQRKHDPREERADASGGPDAYAAYPEGDDEPVDYGEGWLAHMREAVRSWWQYHPAHMVADLAAPVMRGYARRKPWQLLGISVAAGALLTFARPWKLISIGTLLLVVLKSAPLSHLLTAAMHASPPRDRDRPL
jgi:hypothetical protein